ncbi:uncharacterized protein ANIA_00801 [Aspergillus nidulans FGSC A4]|uniref:Acetyl-CoA synthetase-like protein n=1 Tax=Emericella nidulans (strain FGSC A4 / ATCC 38163 / CBS 112.46 / NRRL 194 / M139) TaxID=227321 RepID=C8VQH5_EMENI|nr:hypothetical protein [Aspergillus nidulans FGSC A4]CBF88756.1 TPA: conserved hypothetical protein [Aspergillus nidulans FGSC A4]
MTVLTSPLRIPIPVTDVASFVFSSGTPTTRQTPQYFDASNPSKNFSLAQAEVLVKQIAKGLEDLGLQPNDKVLLYSHNALFFPVLLWGVLAGRCVFTAVAGGASVKEVEYQLRNSDAKLILAGSTQVPVALDAASRVGLPRDRVYLFCDPEDISNDSSLPVQPWTRIWRPADEVRSWSWKRIQTLKEAQETTAIINYSSGCISHYNAIANSSQLLAKRAIISNDHRGKSRKERLDMAGDRWLAPLPMYHAYGQTYYCLNAARLGAKVFIMKSFNVDQYLLYMDIYRINFMASVPAIMATLAKQPNTSRYNLRAVEIVTSGSAPLSAELGGIIEKLYLRPGVTVKQGWGMTEATCSITGFAPDEEDDGRSIGWLNPNCAARIEKLEGRDFSGVAPDGADVGEIWVAGPNVMKGYYKNPTATNETIVEENGLRWLKTGDIGYFDQRGRMYIVDRLKVYHMCPNPRIYNKLTRIQELIKVKGLQVAPAELEQYLLTHPSVADAAVVGARINGAEYPRAFVVRKDDTVAEHELFDMVKAHFAPHKWLTGGVYFIDQIPRTGSGKIMRRNLPVIDESLPRSKL